jgi:hypothetical protein
VANILKILRSLTAGNRPSGHTYGELYVNTADGQLGVINSGNNPQDLIGVPIFTTAASYAQGTVVQQGGLLWMSAVAVSPGTFNPLQWSPLMGSQGGIYSNGRLSVASSTQLQFKPYGGSYIRINGILVKIPNAGIPGLGVTGVFVNGVASQNLVAGTRYLIFAFMNSGVMTADFRTDSSHGPSTTSGNEGTEVKFIGTTEDPTRSLIGMCQTLGGPTFGDTAANRLTLSWFNNKPRSLNGGTVSTGGNPAPWVNIGSQVNWINWANDSVSLQSGGNQLVLVSGSGPQTAYLTIGLDQTSTATGGSNACTPPIINVGDFLAAAMVLANLAEGFHFATLLVGTAGGDGSFQWNHALYGMTGQ